MKLNIFLQKEDKERLLKVETTSITPQELDDMIKDKNLERLKNFFETIDDKDGRKINFEEVIGFEVTS